MFDQHHRTEGVGAEGEEGGVVVDLRGRLFGVEDARDAEGEAEVGLVFGQ